MLSSRSYAEAALTLGPGFSLGLPRGYVTAVTVATLATVVPHRNGVDVRTSVAAANAAERRNDGTYTWRRTWFSVDLKRHRWVARRAQQVQTPNLDFQSGSAPGKGKASAA